MGEENIDAGPCTVTLDGVDLGLTQGGVDFSVDTTTRDVLADQFGSSPVSTTITGRQVTVSIPLLEVTKANMAQLIPGATLVGTGLVTRVDVQTAVGTNLVSTAKELRLHPISMDNDPNPDRLDIVVHNAATAGNVSFSYNSEDERVLSLEFTGYASTTNALFSYGSDAAA